MLSFDLLGISFSNHLLARWQIAFIGSPVVRIEPRYAKWLQQSLQLQKHGILSITEHIGEDFPRVMANRVPKPTLVFLAADMTPHLVKLGTFNFLNINNNFRRIQAFQHRTVDRVEARFFFFSSLMTVAGLIFRTLAVSLIPLPLTAMSMI